MKLRPQGFPRYRDKASNLSAEVNKYLLENGLRPTEDHSLYSLRHSFYIRILERFCICRYLFSFNFLTYY
jgi:hypothetical protein